MFSDWGGMEVKIVKSCGMILGLLPVAGRLLETYGGKGHGGVKEDVQHVRATPPVRG
jgi:hypothetical protein